MSRYAAQTSVPIDRSRAEIERTLQRYGASSFAYGWEGNRALVGFEMHGRRVRFVLPFPERDDPDFLRTPTGRRRTETEAERLYEQAIRQRWRALALAVKAKLEVVESGIAEFEDEFLAYIVVPGGQTVGEWARPQLAAIYEEDELPELMPLPRSRLALTERASAG